MENFISYILILLICVGYFASVVYHAASGHCDEWWLPFVVGAIYPFFWLYENRFPIVGAIVFLSLLIGLPVLIAEGVHWVGSIL